MTFTYKLAQRLARLKHRTAAVATVVVAIIVGCELPVRTTGTGSTITQLVIAPKNVTLQPNQAYDFVAVGFTATGDSADVSVTWSASDGAVTSTNNGKAHYGHYQDGNCGAFKVAATSHPGNLSDTAYVTVAGCTVPVASVSVSPASATVLAGQAVQLTATLKDANGNVLSGRVVTWASSNTSVAIADVNGNVTAIAPGSATITATSEGQSGTAAITVTNVPVASVTVTPASASIQQGQTIQLTATPKDANGNALTGRVVTWSSSNTSVASVNAGGFVTSGAAGSATITAASEGKSGTSAITVTSVPVASVTVSPAPASVQAGQTVQLTATPKDVNGNPLTGRVVSWSSSNTAVATVNASGLVTGVVAGSATITATSEGQSGTSAITVTPPSSTCPTSSTAFQNSAFTSQNGAFTATFDATPNGTGLDATTGLSQGAAAAYTDLAIIVRFNTGGTIDARNGGAYAATNSIAYTAGTGYHFRVVVDVSSHTYSVYVTPAGGAEQTIGTGFAFRTEQSGVTALANWALTAITGTHTVCNFAITGSQPPAPVATVTLTPASATVNEGQTLQLTATLKDANGNVLTGRSITWSSSNSSGATVNGTGLVTGVVAGSATITATSEGQSGTSAITVVHMPVASVTVTPASGTVSAGSSLQLTATPKDANGNPLVGRTVTWQSSNTVAATVNG
ncbi:MAG TPA: Ig-like domain-containing protein, partial [Gemmatimonadales bacterium]|nr:Ig-like domain-containing protein [Gemmatimonadales bacterium]